jgi:hypothetical protein
MMDVIIWTNNLALFTAEGFNFEEFNSDGLQDKHAVAALNLETTTPEINALTLCHFHSVCFLPRRDGY